MAATRHVYLNAAELDALEELTREYGMSDSGVFRLGLRILAGLTVPARMLRLVREQLQEEPGVNEATAINR